MQEKIDSLALALRLPFVRRCVLLMRLRNRALKGSLGALLEYPFLRGKTIVTFSFSGRTTCFGPDRGLQSPEYDAFGA
jgi:hypothetical protein